MIGTAIGQYQIREKIGEGGMGEVFLADDITLQRRVALKFLPPHLAESTEYRDRFLVEARAAAALSHPNICVIHEIGDVDGRQFIAMEYVEGTTLQESVRSGSVGLDEAVELFSQILAGLAEAHVHGVAHRDIKSSNIMVTPDGRAKIMDFGLAKVRGGPALTKTLTTLGTVAYMSPEQAAGRDVDHRSDLWSAGVVFFEMLNGTLPFAGDGETAVIYQILHEAPAPIVDRQPAIPPELRKVVRKALRKDLAKRYATADEILADIREYQDAARAEAAGFISFSSLARRLRRPAVGVPVSLAILGLVAGGMWLTQRQERIRWAREEALPEIRALIQENDVWRNLWAPYQKALEAEKILGDDPELQALFTETARNIDVTTEPAGATVFIKEYVDPEAEWTLLGVTPLEDVRVPIGILRWKVEKEGYEPVLAAASTWNLGGQEDLLSGHDFFRRLDPVGTVPEGMVRVQGTETRVGLLGDFFIGRYEVTNREYRDFIDAGGYGDPAFWPDSIEVDGSWLSWEEARGGFVDESGQPGPSTWVGGSYPQGQDDHPVSGVSWYEAAAYAEWAGLALPTATHWNVARGGLTPMFQWPQLGGFGIFAPFANFSTQGPVQVGSMSGVTAFGAFDMPGNVREWCWNRGVEGRTVRGGAWVDNTYDFEMTRHAPSMDRSPRNGFRVAHYPDPELIPDAAFGLWETLVDLDHLAAEPVSDEVFQAYVDQFGYDPANLNAQVDESWESPGGWTHEVVSYDAAYGGERILGHLFLPSNADPPYQTVVYFPGNATSFMPSSEGLEDYYEFTMFLAHLIRGGRAVFFPVYQGTFERSTPEVMALLAYPRNWGTRAYSELIIQDVQDVRRSIDYLESRPDIDAERLAYYGMSWGGNLAGVILAVERRFRVGVLVAAGLVGTARAEVLDVNYVTRVRTPTLILNGRYDVLYPVERSARPFFDLLGTAPEDKKLLLYETDHIPPRTEYIKETGAWLDKYLGPVGG